MAPRMCSSTLSGEHHVPIPTRVVEDHGYRFAFGVCGCCGVESVEITRIEVLGTAVNPP